MDEQRTQRGDLIGDVQDTAHWVAMYRAWESERPDALFRDPYARRLAGEKGEAIARGIAQRGDDAWAFVIRTVLFDELIERQVEQGVDMIVNLAAGLDARPYRMSLPDHLRWVEIDHGKVLDYKEHLLHSERPSCQVERVPLDLSNVEARRSLFERLGGTAKRALVLSEGLLIYLSADEVASLAADLAAVAGFRLWASDLSSPALMRMMQQRMSAQAPAGRATLKFAPEEGPRFFVDYGWTPVETRSLLRHAARVKRVSLPLRIIARVPDWIWPRRFRLWSAVCLTVRNE